MRCARAIILLHSFVKISASFPRASGERYMCVCTRRGRPSLNKRLLFSALVQDYYSAAMQCTGTRAHYTRTLNSHCCVPSKGRSIERHALSSCNNDGPRASLYALSFITTRSAALSRLYFISRSNALPFPSRGCQDWFRKITDMLRSYEDFISFSVKDEYIFLDRYRLVLC